MFAHQTKPLGPLGWLLWTLLGLVCREAAVSESPRRDDKALAA